MSTDQTAATIPVTISTDPAQGGTYASGSIAVAGGGGGGNARWAGVGYKGVSDFNDQVRKINTVRLVSTTNIVNLSGYGTGVSAIYPFYSADAGQDTIVGGTYAQQSLNGQTVELSLDALATPNGAKMRCAFDCYLTGVNPSATVLTATFKFIDGGSAGGALTATCKVLTAGQTSQDTASTLWANIASAATAGSASIGTTAGTRTFTFNATGIAAAQAALGSTSPLCVGFRSNLEATVGFDLINTGIAATAINQAFLVLTWGIQIDGVTLAVDDRVLLTGQTTASQNGIWVVKDGPWVRPDDSTDADTIPAAAFVWVSEGTTYGNSGWHLTTDDPITVGTTSQTWSKFSGLGGVTVTAPIVKTGDNISLTTPLTAVFGGTGFAGYASKGDILASDSATTLAKVGVGADGKLLMADSAQTSGVGYSTIDADFNLKQIKNIILESVDIDSYSAVNNKRLFFDTSATYAPGSVSFDHPAHGVVFLVDSSHMPGPSEIGVGDGSGLGLTGLAVGNPYETIRSNSSGNAFESGPVNLASANATTGTLPTNRGGWGSTTGTLTSLDISLATLGKKFKVKQGSNAACGRATLVNGTVTVSTTAVATADEIFLTRRVATGTTIGVLSIGTVTAATSFVINALTLANVVDTNDGSQVSWELRGSA